MIMPDFYLKRGDNLSEIQVQLVDAMNVPVNLFGATVKFIMRSFVTGQIQFANDAEIVHPAEGVVAYAWQLADTQTAAGDYFAEWQISKSGVAVQTFPTRGYHHISIQDDLDTPNLTAESFMAVRQLRGKIAEESQDPYSDSTLSAMLSRNGEKINRTAAEIWRNKAAAYSELVDTTESGSSYKFSQLYANARKEAETYEAAADTEDGIGVAVARPTTRAIVRI